MAIDLDRYVTLISVLLGLALEDLLSQVRSADIKDPWVWIVGISMLTFYVSVAIVASIAWISTFYTLWKGLLDRAQNAA